MSEWVAWIDIEDDGRGFGPRPPNGMTRLYVRHSAPVKLTPSRGAAARYPSESQAVAAAEAAAKPGTACGAEEIPRKSGGLRSRGSD